MSAQFLTFYKTAAASAGYLLSHEETRAARKAFEAKSPLPPTARGLIWPLREPEGMHRRATRAGRNLRTDLARFSINKIYIATMAEVRSCAGEQFQRGHVLGGQSNRLFRVFFISVSELSFLGTDPQLNGTGQIANSIKIGALGLNITAPWCLRVKAPQAKVDASKS